MTQLSNAELASLKVRCQQAARRGYAVGQAAHYARLLAAETRQGVVPAGMTNGSAEHLLYLCKKAEAQRAGKKPAPQPVKPPAPAPQPALVKPAEPPKVETVEVADEVVVEESVGEADVADLIPAVEDLEKMTKAELYDVAQEIDLDGRGDLNKADLLAALKKLKG